MKKKCPGLRSLWFWRVVWVQARSSATGLNRPLTLRVFVPLCFEVCCESGAVAISCFITRTLGPWFLVETHPTRPLLCFREASQRTLGWTAVHCPVASRARGPVLAWSQDSRSCGLGVGTYAVPCSRTAEARTRLFCPFCFTWGGGGILAPLRPGAPRALVFGATFHATRKNVRRRHLCFGFVWVLARSSAADL